MKKHFPEYYKPTSEELSLLFKEAIFIFDTNTLINLYRYPEETREDFFITLEKLSKQSQIWIPFQVALEFQKNRLSEISNQKNKIHKVQKVINKIKDQLKADIKDLNLRNRHSYINPDELIKNINHAFDEYIKSLKELDDQQPDINDEDKIRDRIDNLIGDFVGEPFTKEDLDKIQKDGAERYKIKQPPGYKDIDKKGAVTFYRDLTIKDEYGDLLVWKELLAFVTNKKEKSFILVTDDNKEDWWQIVSGKTIGPRPELLAEMTSVTGVSKFYIYNSGRFMDLAKEHLNPEVKTQSIKEVKNIASKQSKHSKNAHIKLNNLNFNKFKRQPHLFKDAQYNEHPKRMLEEEYEEMMREEEAERRAEEEEYEEMMREEEAERRAEEEEHEEMMREEEAERRAEEEEHEEMMREEEAERRAEEDHEEMMREEEARFKDL